MDCAEDILGARRAEFQRRPLIFQDFYKSMIEEEIWAITTEQFSTLILSSPTDDNYLQSKSSSPVTKHECGCDQRFGQLPEAQQCPICRYLEKLSAQRALVFNRDL